MFGVRCNTDTLWQHFAEIAKDHQNGVFAIEQRESHWSGSCRKQRKSCWAKRSGFKARNSAFDSGLENQTAHQTAHQTAQHKEILHSVGPVVQLPEFWQFPRFCHCDLLFSSPVFRDIQIGHTVACSWSVLAQPKLNTSKAEGDTERLAAYVKKVEEQPNSPSSFGWTRVQRSG